MSEDTAHAAGKPNTRSRRAAHQLLRSSMGLLEIALGVTLMVAALAPAILWRSHAPTFHSLTPTTFFGTQQRESTGLPSTWPPSQNHYESAVTDPQRVLIPAIDLAATMVPLDVRSDGSLAVPEDFSLTGWYVNGPEPGEPGPAVVVGHVDSHAGPAVFFRLHEVAPGDRIVIEATDGAAFTFIVERIERHPKTSFPTVAVYGATHQPDLRLITCTGIFDRTTASYRDNIVVFAKLVA